MDLPAVPRAPELVEVHGRDQHGSDGDLLPEGLDADDDEAVAEHGRDEDADDGAEDRPDTAEQAGAADHDRRDGVEVVGRVAADGGGAEARQTQEACQAGQRAAEAVDLDQVAVDVDARAPHGLLVGADRVRVAAEARLGEHDRRDQRDDRGDDRQVGHLVEQPPGTDRLDQLEGDVALVDAAGDQQRGAERHAECAERDDERRDLGLGDEEAVEDPPGHAREDRHDAPDGDHAPVVAPDPVHDLGRDHAREHEHRADRQVDAGGDDDEGQAGGDHEQDRGVRGDVARVGDGEELLEAQHGEDDDHPDEDQEDRGARAGQEPHPPRLAGLGRLLGERLVAHWSPSWKVSAPVMADTTSSIETSCGLRRATRAPSRRTSMRSATSKTSGMFWPIRTTDRPWSRTRLIWSSTLRVCTTPSAAVGSAIDTTLVAQVTARQMAMPWRWPPDMFATRGPGSWIVTPSCSKASSLRRRISLLSRKPSLPSTPGRRISRPRNMFAAGSTSAASARSW